MKDIKKIVIAGAGTMGYSMAQIFAQNGYDVTLYNHKEETLKKAETNIKHNVETLVSAHELTQEQAHTLLGHLEYTMSKECFAHCDYIVENIVENLDIKLAFYKDITPMIPEETIICTNTSGLSINKLASAVKYPERFIGMHWFNPPHLIPLIEIIRGQETTQEVVDTVYYISQKIGKKPVVVNKDVPGFAANRIQLAVLREALYMVEEGIVSPEGVDDVMKYGLGFRYACLGPLETVDFGGIDTFEHISDYLMPDLCDSKEIPALLEKHYQNNELGVKTKKGFYDYSDGKDIEATKQRDEKLIKLYNALYKE